MVLVAVLGRKRSGKDTFSDYIIKKYGFIKYSFADPLKKGIQAFFNLSNEQLYDEKLKETIDERWGVTPRTLFQVIGTDIFQHTIKSFLPELKGEPRKHWVILFKEWYLDLMQKNPNSLVIVSDARFLHELTEIKELGGIIIKIIRPLSETNGDLHQSEKEIDDIPEELINYKIKNDSSLDNFYQKINEIIII
jgi:adenylate kinase family enzyme